MILALALPGVAAAAPSNADLNKRLTVLENRMDNAALAEMSNNMEALRHEVQQLQGEIQTLRRELDQLKQRQRDLYMDVDGRLRKLEKAQEAGQENGQEKPAAPTQGNGGGAPQNGGGQGAGGQGTGSGGQGAASGNGGQGKVGAYKSALDTLKAGRYKEASKAFEAYLRNYPDSGYDDNARYWLGESYYVVRNFDTAKKQFQKVLDDYPKSAKRPAALLKIGFIQYEQGDFKQARQTLEQVRKQYPDSHAAPLAEDRLERMSSEGH